MAVMFSRIVALISVATVASGTFASALNTSTGVDVVLPHACSLHGDARDLVVRYLPGGKLWLNSEPLDENILRSRVQGDLAKRAEKLLCEVVDIVSKFSRDNPGLYIALATKAQTGAVDPADPEFRKAQLNPNLGIYSLCVQSPEKLHYR
jgi:hypothetical protein